MKNIFYIILFILALTCLFIVFLYNPDNEFISDDTKNTTKIQKPNTTNSSPSQLNLTKKTNTTTAKLQTKTKKQPIKKEFILTSTKTLDYNISILSDENLTFDKNSFAILSNDLSFVDFNLKIPIIKDKNLTLKITDLIDKKVNYIKLDNIKQNSRYTISNELKIKKIDSIKLKKEQITIMPL